MRGFKVKSTGGCWCCASITLCERASVYCNQPLMLPSLLPLPRRWRGRGHSVPIKRVPFRLFCSPLSFFAIFHPVVHSYRQECVCSNPDFQGDNGLLLLPFSRRVASTTKHRGFEVSAHSHTHIYIVVDVTRFEKGSKRRPLSP